MNRFLSMQKAALIDENPTFVQFLALCPTLAVTTTLSGGFFMGLSVVLVLTCSNLFVSSIRNLVPDNIRIPVYITIIASLVTVIGLLLETFVPSVYEQLGIYLPLIVVNCIILGRAEAFASQNKVGISTLDGLTTGIAFAISLITIGFLRELLGTGSVSSLHIEVMQSAEAFRLFATGPGAFFTVGILAWTFTNWKTNREKKLKAMKRGAK